MTHIDGISADGLLLVIYVGHYSKNVYVVLLWLTAD